MKSAGCWVGKWPGLVVLLLFLLGCSGEPPKKAEKPKPAEKKAETPVQSGGPAAQILPPLRLEAFGELTPSRPMDLKPVLQDQAATVEKAANYQAVMKMLGTKLSPAQKNFLNRHKFLLVPKRATNLAAVEEETSYDEMLGIFDRLGGPLEPFYRQPCHAKLVNPDVVLHAFHKYLENSLEHLEKTVLVQDLRKFVQSLQSQALAARKISSDDLARHYELIAAQLTVPLVILNNARWPAEEGTEKRLPEPGEAAKPDDSDTLENALGLLKPYETAFSPEIQAKTREELKYIYEAKDTPASGGKSPLFGHYDAFYPSDYSQFTPRSHYTKSSLLRAYFRAMMYLGRNYYNLRNENGITDALLLAHLMATPTDQGESLKRWRRLMEITSFYVGLPDDISYPEWRDFIVNISGTEKFEPSTALSPEFLIKISANIEKLKPPVISLTRGEQVDIGKLNFRLFGQRFTFDGWMLNHLTAKEPGDTPPFPTTPSALFVPAALGNPTARSFLPLVLREDMPELTPAHLDVFEARLNKLSHTLAQVEERDWFSAIGWVWLKLLGTLNASFSEGYPLYMQSPLFPIKQLETFLGSYTELKHDTLLYAKQSYAEMGNGDEGKIPPVPRGFVEPNLPFWVMMERLVAYTAAGFRKFQLFPGDLEEYGKLQRFKQQVEFFTAMAEKELRGQPLSEKEYEKIRTLDLSYLAIPPDGEVLDPKDRRSALIADIHTDMAKKQVLYEATGEPYIMLALVGNEGRPRLTVGVAFNHYEFTGPLTIRYSDADWQGWVYEAPGKMPPKNFWYKDLLVR
ncbi:MAG: DUF3160 domain-containing protein [Desulfobaccales bacterium]